MAYCSNCGTHIEDGAKFCPNCGAAQAAEVKAAAPVNTNSYDPYSSPAPAYNQAPAADDKGGFGWGLLGFCIPLVGLILFLVWKDTKPRTSKAAGKGALTCVIMFAVFYIILFAIGLAGSLL